MNPCWAIRAHPGLGSARNIQCPRRAQRAESRCRRGTEGKSSEKVSTGAKGGKEKGDGKGAKKALGPASEHSRVQATDIEDV